MPLGCRRVASRAALTLFFAGCSPSPTTLTAQGPEAGQALALAVRVSQSARAFANELAASPPPQCRTALRCEAGALTVVRTLGFRRNLGSVVSESSEVRTWRRDAVGNRSLSVTLSRAAANGGKPSRELSLVRIGTERFGALDGAFVHAESAPLLDAALDADPSEAFDALIASVGDARCPRPPLRLPGRLVSGSASVVADRRTVEAEMALPAGGSLRLLAEERTTCGSDPILAPEAARPSGPDVELELSRLAAKGLEEGWLLPPAGPPER